MQRTQNRPIPKGRISKNAAYLIGTGLTATSFVAYAQFEPYTFLVAYSIWLAYLRIYIPMKLTSDSNTMIGSIVGALPPFIGSYAVTGQLFLPETMLLSAYIFSWQFPHFYGILYMYKDDYKKAGYQMISDVDPKGQLASTQIMGCQILNSLLPLAMMSQGMIHPAVLVPFYASQIQAFKSVYKFKKEGANKQSARQLKIDSYLPFLTLLFGFVGTTIYKKKYPQPSEKQLPSQELVIQ